jgi:aminoglycoside phosphotransferase family enzyme/predicted kinase
MTFDIASMLKPRVYDHPVKKLELIETHISWVVLTGDFAYKIKKPVDFGFLDFSTLEKRQAFCEQELVLNRRLAPEIYLDVVAITGTSDKPRISDHNETDENEVFEYAVKMTQFPQSAQLDNMLTAGELKAKHMGAIARMVADFHQNTKIADNTMDYGKNELIYQPVEENFLQINRHIDTTPYAETLEKLRQWSRSEFKKLATVFKQRKSNGFVRECHGDMHLRNLLWLDGQPQAFDCIEFNSALRWIDVISEVAFLVMDLQDRQRHQLANRFLNSYLEATGDYAGLCVLPFYLCYRALVRAKVNALRLEQKSIPEQEREKILKEISTYLELATAYTQQPVPKLMIMRGPSASGKSTVSQQLLEILGAIRIRSDVERKRLFDIDPGSSASTGSTADKIDSGIYSKQASLQTYTKLAELASEIINAGYSVIIDAAFLRYEQRKPFQQLADSLAVSYIILEITAPPEVLRQRIRARKHDVSDADLTVLEHQLANWQPLHKDEMNTAISVNTGEVLEMNVLVDKIKKLL